MRTKTKPLIKAILLWMAICSFTAVSAQTLTVTDSSTSSCNNDGQVSVYVYNGTAPYTYTLVGVYGTVFGPVTQASPHFTGLGQGYYSVIVSDVNGLNNIAQPAYAYVYATFYTGVNVYPAICPATTGTEAVYVYNGSGNYGYQWSNGATTDSILNVPIGAHYQCTVTDVGSGCIALASDSGGMFQTSSITYTSTTTPANCTNGTATITAANGVSPYTYLWANGQTTATATGLSPGYALVTITDAQGCTAIAYNNIQQAITLTSTINTTAEHCNDGNGTLTITPVNGTAPFAYVWSSGQTTDHITNLSAGYYSVQYTDHSGCTGNNYGQVQKSTPIVLTTSSTLTTCATPTGTATVVATGGTPPYSYDWSCVPAQGTATATGLSAGYYVVNVVDAVGCTQNQSATVSNNTNLYAIVSATNAQCGGAAGNAVVSVSGGSTPYTYSWNTGASTSSIGGITQAGYYDCLVTDHLGCTVSPGTYVQSVSPVSLYASTTSASCIFTADGSALLNPVGGQSPYTYFWVGGSGSASATGLPTGDYGAYVTDAHGCPANTIFHIGYASISPCAAILTGNVISDHNANCILDYGQDQNLGNVWISCLPGGGYQWTTNGYYNFVMQPGTYTISQAPPVHYTVICPTTSPTVTLSAGQSSNNDFFDQPDTIRDLTINCIPYTFPRAGFTQHLKLFIGNLGNIDQAPDVVYVHALDINFLSANPQPDSYDPTTHKLSWSRPTLSSTGSDAIDMYFDIPSNLPIGHILNNSDTVYPFINDVDTFNNFEDAQALVVASYDPNYIDVTPKGSGNPGYISATTDTTLRYVVHFQNTGSYPATYVTLKMPIDANLDLSTFHFIGASHQVSSISADASRLLTIRFDNINLPDSSVSQLGSQGFAAYTFKQKKGLHGGNTINQQANIYFDFNTPVATNTALNTIESGAGIQDIKAGSLRLYPNPTQGNVILDLSAADESRVAVKVYDVMGRIAIEMPNANVPASKKLNLSTSGLATGVYTVEVTGNASYVQKLVKTDK